MSFAEMFCTAACTPVLVRCTYEDLEATEVACPDGCGARALVLIDACNTGVEASLAEIEADMVCEILDSTPY